MQTGDSTRRFAKIFNTRKSFKAKIIVPTVLVLAALVVALNIYLAMRFSAMRDRLVDERLAANRKSLELHLAASRESTRAAALLMASNPAVIQAVKERDRKALLDLFTPTHDLYRVNYFTICDSEGIVLARNYDAERFGDSIANQQNIRNALAGNVATYFEPGTAIKVGLRTGVPVRDTDGALIGVVSAGVMFDTDKAVDELKRLFDSEVTVISGDTRVATTIMQDGQRAVGTQIDPDIAKTVIGGGREYANGVDIFGKRYKAFYQPLMNAQNEAFAAIILAIPVADLEAASNRAIRDGILLGLCGLAVSIVLLFYIISSISDPIVKLSRDVRHIADGNLDIDINADGDDEVGHLGRSVRVVAATLSKLLSDIDIMIAEREKGHTDYHLNAEEFLGAYKALADNILDLTDIGMKDQLTGIPNRRSFDNRLDMEWGRAMREKKPISVLIADVDKFKTYNDAYGHPQGDVALKTVAEVLNGAVRRSIDIAARWGGEEFVALLPGTDSDGAMAVAEKIRAAIENASIPCADPKAAKVTASVGVNTRIPAPGVLVRDFISAADDALYQAKEAGRNRVVLARVAPEA